MPENRPNNCPVIFLAFANDQERKNQYLRNLPEELRAIRDTINSASKAGLCELVERANVSIKEIYDVFQEYGERIAIFHYGGHSNSYEFLLEADNQNQSPAFATGLIPFLAKQPALELVFFNGCSTELHAEELILAGIPAVIGTSQEISDAIACRLAIRFYKGLGQGLGIATSWEDAISEIKTWKGDQLRGAVLRDEVQQSSQLPWKIFFRPGAENIKNWSLPIAVNNPLFGLPDISGTYDLPDTPYRFLERYKKEDAKIFFGRGAAIRELYQKITGLNSSPMILLSGQSGVGKSSLLEAGLYPRLESTHNILYIRRNQALGLLESLQEALIKNNEPLPAKTFDLPKVWKDLEAKTKKPLVVILDQVEETYTRPNNDLINELNDFLNAIKDVFNDFYNRPNGKLILSYRKEFHTNIRDAISSFKIHKDYVSLDRLSKFEIQAIVRGLSTSERLKSKYHLHVEKELPDIIADNLWKDKDTPIAPVLQIILTKLWQQQEAQNQSKGTLQKVFSVDHYNRLLDEGILLDDFFQQQMSKIQSWENAFGKTAYESGLALDILHFHTTDLGSAESRSLELLRQEYEHRAEVLDTLFIRFKELYLLTNTFDNKNIALAHDTLAPIVQKAMRDSGKPGQRAKRILESKAIDFDLNPDTYMDEEDLALVEQGADGMRIWTRKEERIIERSRIRRAALEAERQQNEEDKKQSILFRERTLVKQKRNNAFVASLFFLLALAAGIFGWNSKKQSKVNMLISDALQMEKINPTKAYEIIKQAEIIAPRNKTVLQTKHDIYSDNEFYKTLLTFNDPITAIAPYNHGKNIALAIENNIILVDSLGNQIAALDCGSEILSIAISPDDQYLLAGCQDDIARLWRTNTPSIISLLEGHEGRILDVAFSRDGKRILTASSDATAILWNLKGNDLNIFKGHSAGVSCVDFSPSGDTILTGSYDKTIKLWDINGTALDTLTGHQNSVFDVSFSSDGQQILSGSRDKTARLWDTSGPLISKFVGHKKRINKAIFIPENDLILTASDDKTAKLWNKEGLLLKSYQGHESFVLDIIFAENKNVFVTTSTNFNADGSANSNVKFWKPYSKVLRELKAYDKAVSDMEISPNNKFLFTAKNGGMNELINSFLEADNDFSILDWMSNPSPSILSIWNLENNSFVKQFEEHTGGIYDIDLSLSGNLLASASDDTTAIIRNLETGSMVTLTGHQAEVYAVTISPNSNSILTGSADSTAKVWNMTGKLLLTLPHHNIVSATAISTDNQRLFTACYDGYIRIWNSKGNKIDSIQAHDKRVLAIRFSPDGKYFLTGSQDNTAKLWSSSGKLIQTFVMTASNNTGGEGINSVAFSPDGKLVLLGAEGGVAKVFNLDGQEIQTVDDFDGKSVHSVSFDQVAKAFVVGSGDGRVRFFESIANQ